MFDLVLRPYHFLTENSLQSADKDQQENCTVAEKLHDAVVKFDTYRNLQRHCAVLPAVARHLVCIQCAWCVVVVFHANHL